MNIDDPQITAYALGETGELDATGRAEIEAALTTDPKLAAEIAELRALADGLRRELHSEQGASLTSDQRSALMESVATTGAAENATAPSAPNEGNIIIERPHAWWRSVSFASAAAACVVVGVAAWLLGRTQGFYREHVSGSDAAGFKVAVEDASRGPENAPLELAQVAATPAAATAANAPQWTSQPSVIRTMTESDPSTFQVDTAPLPVTAPSTRTALKDISATSPTGGLGMMSGSSSHLSMRGAMPTTAQPMPRKMNDRFGGAAMGRTSTALAFSAQPGGDGASASRAGRLREVESELSTITKDLGSLKMSMSGISVGEVEKKLVEKEAELRQLNAIITPNAEQKAKMAETSKAVDALKYIKSTQEKEPREFKELEEHVAALLREKSELEQTEPSNTEAYDSITDNPFLGSKENPLSTFSIDVDTASYTNIRRMLNGNSRPPKGAVRIEELINYFHYDYPQPDGDHPFGATLEAATCPWQPDHRLVRIGIKAREIPKNQRPPSNLVFLVDVSGSMEPENKLPLVKECLRLLTDQLGEEDSVSIAVYAGASGCVLEPTHDKNKVRAALERLSSGGSTNGAAGIQLAYDLAQRAFKKGGTNRVILCTDGDFNVGISDQSQLVSMIQAKAKTGVFLSVLGFGMGNLKDSTLEKLADKGNGTYGYIDSLTEGRRVFVDQLSGTLCTVAKDVKIQVEFNPAQVSSYRLIGYENRMLAKEDFNDDTKDAGEIGAGHTVTALYEVVSAGKPAVGVASVDELKYSQPAVTNAPVSAELLTVKVRYKQPTEDVSTKLEFPLSDAGTTWEKSSRDFRWAAAVAGFGMMLRESPNKGSLSWGLVEELAAEGRDDRGNADRVEFVSLVDKARAMSR